MDSIKFSSQDWLRLSELRDIFLEENAPASYWASLRDVELYDETFSKRISWKISAVLNEFSQKQVSFKAKKILDFGCGSGVFVETFLEKHSDHNIFPEVVLYDRSEIAMDYTQAKLQKKYPSLKISICTKDSLVEAFKESLVLCSHVLGELSSSYMEVFKGNLKFAQGLICIEPGTPKHFNKLNHLRETLRKEFFLLAPCPHSKMCPLTKNEHDWCHNFAPVPTEIFHSRFWNEFSKKLKIDLRSLPYCYLAVSNEDLKTPDGFKRNRHIGRARVLKASVKTQWCQSNGEVKEIEYSKREHPEIFKAFKKNPEIIEL